MPFQKGRPKTGGKKKGSPHLSLAADVRSRLEALGCDPIEGMARIAMDPATPVAVAQRCHADLAQYVYPKLRAMELSGPDGSAIPLSGVITVELVRAKDGRLDDEA